jgi:hypothetical protein
MTLDPTARSLADLVRQAQTVQQATAPSGGRAGQLISLRVGGRPVQARCLVSFGPGPVVAVLTPQGWACMPVAATRQVGVRPVEFRQRRGGAVPSQATALIKFYMGSLVDGGSTTYIVNNGTALQTVTFADSVSLYLATDVIATGPNPNDWIAVHNDIDTEVVSFYNSSGVVATQSFSSFRNATFGVRQSGNFWSIDQRVNFSSYRGGWIAQGSTGTGSSFPSQGDYDIGAGMFVLPNVSTGPRINTFTLLINDSLRQWATHSHDYSHAVFRGDLPASGSGFSSGNPWIVTADGTFSRSPVDFNFVFSLNFGRRVLGLQWPFFYYFPGSFPDVFIAGPPEQVSVDVIRLNLESGAIDTIQGVIFNPGELTFSSVGLQGSIYVEHP